MYRNVPLSGGERAGILTVDGNADMPEVKKHTVEEIEHDHEVKLCPECGNELEATNGCFMCSSCGWGKCEL